MPSTGTCELDDTANSLTLGEALDDEPRIAYYSRHLGNVREAIRYKKIMIQLRIKFKFESNCRYIDMNSYFLAEKFTVGDIRNCT